MRYILFLLVLFFMTSNVAYAETVSSTNERHYKHEVTVHDKTVDTNTHRDEKDAEIGVGVDVVVYEGDEGELLNKATVEYKYDINNDDHATYAVVTTKLSDVWAKVKSIFDRGE